MICNQGGVTSANGSDHADQRVHFTAGSEIGSVNYQRFLSAVAMLLARRSLGKFSSASLSRRSLSNRASAVLGALDIPTTPTELPGVYDGEWKGSGEVFQSVCPATGEVLANVKSVRAISPRPARVYPSAYPLTPSPRDPNRHPPRSSMARWIGREKHTYISGVYLLPGEER